jgi:predicted TIM-barrel fold metal-dependent hydrolase
MTGAHGFDILDAHHHSGDLGGWMPGARPATGDGLDDVEIAARLAILDAQGVRQAVVIPGHAYLRPEGLADTRRQNDRIARYRDRHPDRFPAAIGVVEPLYGPAGLAEIDRCWSELGLAGVSFHTRFQGVSIDSPWVSTYCERIGSHGMVPYVHCFGQSPEESLWKVDHLAGDLPDLAMVVLDVFADAEQPRQLPRVAERNPNLYFDTALALNFELLVEPVIRAVGADRFVYGSDTYSAPYNTRPAHVLEDLLAMGLDHDATAAILGGTLRRLLRLG